MESYPTGFYNLFRANRNYFQSLKILTSKNKEINYKTKKSKQNLTNLKINFEMLYSKCIPKLVWLHTSEKKS